MFLAPPFENNVMAWKGICGKDQIKSPVRIRNISGQTLDNFICAKDKRLSNQPDALIIKHPHLVVFIWMNHYNCIHHFPF